MDQMKKNIDKSNPSGGISRQGPPADPPPGRTCGREVYAAFPAGYARYERIVVAETVYINANFPGRTAPET